ncbi:MAG: glutathionylspermidine synthase family protein [Hyphomicrobiaceae bacterium]
MERIRVRERSDWRRTAEEHGFDFHSPDGSLYWDESAYYAFTLEEIEEGLESPAAEIESMCFEVVEAACRDEAILKRLAIPERFWGYVAETWRAKHRNLYGRMDFAFDGRGPAKLYEYNADTPTSLYETAVFQWVWLEQAQAQNLIPSGSDQFNSLHERLVTAFGQMGLPPTLHLASVRSSNEDWSTTLYLADCAQQAGLATVMIDISDIGVSTDGRFTDLDDHAIQALFKLYPWEWLLREEFATHIPGAQCQMIEPAWKSVLSNKGLLALLWQRFPGHPNLLPAFFEDDPAAATVGARYVRKPLYSREGANVEILERGSRVPRVSAPGPYGEEGHIVQAYQPLPEFSGERPMCGLWMVASEPAGLGIRADSSEITGNNARYLPHIIRG